MRLPFAVLAAIAWEALPAGHAQTTQDQTGLTALIERLGAGAQPTGNAVPFGQVEAPVNGAYAPDVANPEFVGKTISLKSGASAGASGHATAVGMYGYGLQSSLAPG